MSQKCFYCWTDSTHCSVNFKSVNSGWDSFSGINDFVCKTKSKMSIFFLWIIYIMKIKGSGNILFYKARSHYCYILISNFFFTIINFIFKRDFGLPRVFIHPYFCFLCLYFFNLSTSRGISWLESPRALKYGEMVCKFIDDLFIISNDSVFLSIIRRDKCLFFITYLPNSFGNLPITNIFWFHFLLEFLLTALRILY